MVFSSYVFILFFLPIVVLGITFLKDTKNEVRLIFLSAASLFFYAYWDWSLLWVILFSVVINYFISHLIFSEELFAGKKRLILSVGIIINILLLGYFKYTNFFIDNINSVFNLTFSNLDIILPLGISFFTFQQIAYLVDTYKKKVVDHNFFHYLLFVTFFPQLIAGPIVHHKELLVQFVKGKGGTLSVLMFSRGVTIFVIGLMKKVLIADNIAALYSTPVFDASNAVPIPLIESWCAVLAYSFQIYFDFSAYSDMAIGLGLMLGVRLPINFYSPYKATSVIDFWRRWHITLSRFLRDYLYIPLGGNRIGLVRTNINIMLVMLIGGLWHGASWNFVIWGGLHGVAILINHYWRTHFKYTESSRLKSSFYYIWSCRILTFLYVTILWVFFRSDSFDSSINIINGLIGLNGIALPETYFTYLGNLAPFIQNMGVVFSTGYLFLGVKEILMLAFMLFIVWGMPNSIEFSRYREYLGSKVFAESNISILKWKPNCFWSIGLSIITILCLIFMSNTGEFLYFQF